MNKFTAVIFLLFSAFTLILPQDQGVYRIGIFAGSIRGLNDFPIEDATRDVKTVETLFRDYGRMDETLFLSEPDSQSLSEAFNKAVERVTAGKKERRETQFFFYYVGHGLTDGLLLNTELYSKEKLKNDIAKIPADLKVIFIDSCYSQMMGASGGIRFETASRGTVFVSSSTIYQKAFANTFTPYLKVGLMGDADGYLPGVIESDFFTDHLEPVLSVPQDREKIASLYGYKKTVQMRRLNPDEKKKLMELSVRYQFRPDLTSISTPELKTILNQITLPDDRAWLEFLTGFQNLLILKNSLSEDEKKDLSRILGLAGFKDDHYITLNELYGYITDKIASEKKGRQIPKLNSRYFYHPEELNLGYTEKKGLVVFQYLGTILIEKLDETGLIWKNMLIQKTMGEGETSLSLNPGSYQFTVTREDMVFRVPVTVTEGKTDLPKLDYSNLVRYREKVRDIETWVDKDRAEKGWKLSRAGTIASPIAFTLLSALPLSLLGAGIYYETEYQRLYQVVLGYSNVESEHPDIYNQWIESRTSRDSLYTASAVLSILPVSALAVWMVSIGYYTYYNRSILQIRKRIQSVPELQAGIFSSPRGSGFSISLSCRF